MKNFFYNGINIDGNKLSGYLLAKDKKNAEFILNKRGIIVKKVSQKRKNFKAYFKSNNFEFFINSLSELLLSGLPLTDALEFISSGKVGNSIQNEGLNVYENIKNGSSLSISVQQIFPNASKFHISLISSGEASGKLNNSLKLISDMISENRIKRAELLSSLTYPLILLVSMLALIYFVLEFALPKMLNVMDLSGNLPLPTNILLIAGNILPSTILLIFYIVLIFLVLLVLRNRFIIFQNFLDIILVKIPIIKQIIIFSSRRILLQGYAIGLIGDLTIAEVSNLVMNSMPNLSIKIRMQKLINSIEEGQRFSSAIEQTELLNSHQIASIKIGDETDKLKENFELLKNQFEIKLSLYLKTIIKIVEPTIIVFFGFVILILALGIILPVLNATSVLM